MNFYRTEFGKKILEEELKYVSKALTGCKKILSVGCGPGFLETELMKRGTHEITGLDISEEMLEQVSNPLETVLGTAEKLPFKNETFDAVLFVTSLEFIDDYEKAVLEASRVLQSNGKIVVLILNPDSNYFKEKLKKEISYFHKIKHTNLDELCSFLKKCFFIEDEYFLGIKDKIIFSSCDKRIASLYAIRGVKK